VVLVHADMILNGCGGRDQDKVYGEFRGCSGVFFVERWATNMNLSGLMEMDLINGWSA
jgi:hypothetical protein